MNYLLETAIGAAKEAGNIQLNHLGKEIDIAYKGEVDLVTEVDRECERQIISIISGHYPDHCFLAEEERSADEFESEYRWIIDPLDGTTNYAHGYRFFCTSIALEKKTREDKNIPEIILGVVYDPVTDELFHAEKGNGAFLNGNPIEASKTSELSKSLLCTGFPYDIRESEKNNVDYFNSFIFKSQAVRRDGAAALDLCYVACGRFDGFWELKLRPWDLAAGILIITEAGGIATDFNGVNLDIFTGDAVASNGLIHPEMMDIIKNIVV